MRADVVFDMTECVVTERIPRMLHVVQDDRSPLALDCLQSCGSRIGNTPIVREFESRLKHHQTAGAVVAV